MKPTFIMLIGIPGSGKSTLAQKMANENTVILSSDSIRKELFGDENTQESPEKVFSIMFYRTVKALDKGKDVIYDATNLKKRLRVNTLKRLKEVVKTEFVAKALIIDTDLATAKERNNSRDRVVPEEVLDKMYNNFQLPEYSEGWDIIDTIL